jgi:S1-C subfamily serine protease
MRRPLYACLSLLIVAVFAVPTHASNGFLGVALADLPAGFAGRGAVVQAIAPNSPAQQSDLRLETSSLRRMAMRSAPPLN